MSDQALREITMSSMMGTDCSPVPRAANADAQIGSVTVGGSLQGGAAFASGAIESSSSLDAVTIRGSLFGDAGERSGGIYAASSLGRLTVAGSLHGASGPFSASIESGGGLASAKIGGDVFAGHGALSGAITATNRIGSVSVFGSLFSVVATNFTLGAVSIGGDHFGLIAARGALNPATSAGALTIASVKIGGDLSGSILAGLDYVTDTWTNPDTIIGPISIGGDVSGARVSSGVAPGPNGSTADGDDFVPGGGNGTISSQIVSIIVRGQVGRSDNGVHFGFTAQRIGKLQVGTTVFPLTAGTDRFDIGLFGNVSLREA